MSSEAIAALVEAMVSGGGSRAETFFIAHNLGAGYNSVGKGYGIRKHVNAALLQAERQGRRDEVVSAGLEAYGLKQPRTGGERHMPIDDPTPLPQSARLFISHASNDKALADALADLIRLGTDLPSDRILCTSLEGMGVPAGTMNYLEYLRHEISDAGIVLPLLTPAFFDSEVCLIELGAMWGLEQKAFPLIVPPIDFARVERLLGKVHSARIDKSQGLSDLHDEIVAVFHLAGKTSMWNSKREQFEERLPSLLADLAEGTRVDASDLKKAKKRAARGERHVRELEDELQALKDRFQQLAAAKTESMLREALHPGGGAVEQFNATAQRASNLLDGFTAGVREALYEELGRSELFRPDPYSSHQEEAETALRDDLLGYDEENGGYYLNHDDPAMQEAITAIREVFDNDWGDEVESWFRETHRKTLAIRVRQTWVALDLL